MHNEQETHALSAHDEAIEPLHIKTITEDEQPKRWSFPGWLYAICFIVIDFIAVAILQWGVTLTSTRVQLSSPIVGLGQMIAKIGEGNCVLFFNMLIIGLIYLMFLMIFNRFWIASPLLLSLATIISAAEHFKVESRYETILPSDLNFLNKNTGEIASFLPDDAPSVITWAVVIILICIAVSIIANHFDARHGSMIRVRNLAVGLTLRIAFVLIPSVMIAGYANQVGTVDSWAYHVSRGMGDIPSMWDSVYDAQRNGPVVSFIRQVNPKVMDKPEGYSKQKMQAIAKKYAQEAATLNADRPHALTDSTVVYVLSESFSDPTRVPGVKVNEDPMPFIRSLKGETTSGLMLSSGYGGGTANLEYMGLTGMSMTNFDASLTSPYQQLVPNAHWVPSVNQIWGSPEHSIGLHPYEPSMYSRETNYKKMGFSHFFALKGKDIIAHQDKIDRSPYVSDAATYKSTVEQIKQAKSNQFLQVITMQNHMPYKQWYDNNQYKVTSADPNNPLEKSEISSIETYAKGMEHTDKATQEFLEELDAMDKPITVVFYGDHLPGIYKTAGADDKNSLDLHLTDYFIWSNKASKVPGERMKQHQYSSPNFFMAQAATQMNAKVSPYLAFLTQMHAHIAAMEPPVVNNIQGWDRIPQGQAIYLNDKGEPMSVKDMDATTRQLLDDYKYIQYDITAGNNYLKDTSFMQLPK